MAKSYDIMQKDVNRMFWEEVYAKPDYDPAKDEEYSESFPFIDTPEYTDLKMLATYIRNYIPQIRNGDMIQIGGAGYRNDNLAFWSSTKGVILPDFESGTDYGTIPSDFRVGNGPDEFHPTHWMGISDFYYYDGLIWLSTDLISEINTKIIKNIEETYACEVLIRGKTVKIESAIPEPIKFTVMSDTLIVSYE